MTPRQAGVGVRPEGIEVDRLLEGGSDRPQLRVNHADSRPRGEPSHRAILGPEHDVREIEFVFDAAKDRAIKVGRWTLAPHQVGAGGDGLLVPLLQKRADALAFLRRGPDEPRGITLRGDIAENVLIRE